MNIPTKSDIAAIARKIWPHGERSEGRHTVKVVLEIYRKRIARRRALKRPLPSPNQY